MWSRRYKLLAYLGLFFLKLTYRTLSGALVRSRSSGHDPLVDVSHPEVLCRQNSAVLPLATSSHPDTILSYLVARQLSAWQRTNPFRRRYTLLLL